MSRENVQLEWRPVRRLAGRWLLGSENLIRWSERLAPLVGRLTRRPDVVVDAEGAGRPTAPSGAS